MDLQMGTTSVVEIDETYFSNRKYNRGRVNRGQWGFGGIKRKSGRCLLVPVEDRAAPTLLVLIEKIRH